MYKNILPTLLLLLLSNLNTLYSQNLNCNPYNHKVKKYTVEEGIYYRISTGLCYHYNSSSIDIGYKRNYLSLTFMNPNVHRRTPLMKEEIYIGYTYNLPIGKKQNIHIGFTPAFEIHSYEPVGRFYIDRRIYKRFFLHGSTVQVSNRMNHLIGGIKVVI